MTTQRAGCPCSGVDTCLRLRMVQCQWLLYGRVKKNLDLGRAWHSQPMIEFRIGEGLRDLGALPGSWPTVQAPVVLRPCLIAMPQALLELLLQNWRELLSQWAQSGALSGGNRNL